MRKIQDMAIFVATHKKLDVDFPAGYIPMQVNCAATGEHWEDYYHDDFGDNISSKNPFYSELTVLYSAWKNCNADIKGICHYRRYMNNDSRASFNHRHLCDIKVLGKDVITQDDIQIRMDGENCDVLLVSPAGPYPLTGREELEKFCYEQDIAAMIAVVEEDFSDYAEALHQVLASKNLSYFNMLVAKAEVFDSYCQWIFDVLGKIEQRCDLSGYDTQHKRLYGYLSEVLLNVYFTKHELKKQYVGIVCPYQFVGAEKADYEQQQKRNRQYNFLRKLHLFGVVEKMYQIKNPELYARYSACKKIMQKP